MEKSEVVQKAEKIAAALEFCATNEDCCDNTCPFWGGCRGDSDGQKLQAADTIRVLLAERETLLAERERILNAILGESHA